MKDLIKAAAAGAATAIIGLTILSVLGGLPRPANAFEVPFDWTCQMTANGQSCRAPGLAPKAKPVPTAFLAKFHYPSEIVVEDPDDWSAAKAGWIKRGDCDLLLKVGLSDPRVRMAKRNYCYLWSNGYAAPKPKIVKGW